MKDSFTVDDSKIIKGVAVILMLMHHLWSLPDRLNGTLISHFNIFGENSIIYFGWFGQICVSIFFFLGGYGLYVCSKNKKFSFLDRLKKLFISYWKVFLIFIPIGFIFFSNQLPFNDNSYMIPKFNIFDLKEFISNMLCVSFSYNGEWWFFQSYIYILLTFPLLKKLFDKFSSVTNIFLVVLFSILVSTVFPYLGNIPELGTLNNNYFYKTFLTCTPYASCFWMGIVFAKDDLLIKLKNSINDNIGFNWFYDILGLILIIFLRQSGLGDSLDIIYVPLLIIFILDLLRKSKIIKKILFNIGKNSTSMWLIHSFFCYYYFSVSKLVIGTENAILSLLILIIISYISSIIIDYLWKCIGLVFNGFKKLVRRKTV